MPHLGTPVDDTRLLICPSTRYPFEFLSCSGDTTDNLLSGGERSQIDRFKAFDTTRDIGTLSIGWSGTCLLSHVLCSQFLAGGNDVGFVDILDAWYVRRSGHG